MPPASNRCLLFFSTFVMFCRLTILLLLIIVSVSSIAQTTHVLKLKDKRNYSEQNILFSDSVIIFVNEVCYNEPNTIDEEGCFILKLTLIDTTKARQLKKVDVAKDTTVIKCLFDYLSVWNWEEERTTITGVVGILALTKKSIAVSFNVKVIDNRRNRTYIYIGNRTFEKSKKKNLNEWGFIQQ
jgi:hypothetical protein